MKVVLVVEDEAIIRMLLVDCLENAGFTVREAASGDSAIVMLSGDEAVDAVITDLRMPGSTDGMGLAAWMHEHRRATPLVITSGYVVNDQARAANPGALVVSKPYSPADIATLLEELVGSAGARDLSGREAERDDGGDDTMATRAGDGLSQSQAREGDRHA